MSLEVEIIIYNSSKGYPPAFLEKNIHVENEAGNILEIFWKPLHLTFRGLFGVVLENL